MLDHHAELQLDWDETKLYESWPKRLDHRFLLKRLNELTADTTLAGGAVRVLDVAAAGATHTCEMSLRGACAVKASAPGSFRVEVPPLGYVVCQGLAQ